MRLKLADLIVFLTGQNVRAQKIGCVSEVSRVRARPFGIGLAICPCLFLWLETMSKLSYLCNNWKFTGEKRYLS